MLVAPGDRVKRGQALVKLDDDEAQADVRAKRAGLESSRIALQERRRHSAILEKAYQRGAISEEKYHEDRVATLKAEISHLRSLLGGGIASRPYRIVTPVTCDVADVLEHLRAGRLLDAASAYGGDPLAGTDAPGLVEYGNYLSVAVREALLATPEPAAVLRYAEAVPHDVDVLERAISAIGRSPHPAAPLLRARLRTAHAA